MEATDAKLVEWLAAWPGWERAAAPSNPRFFNSEELSDASLRYGSDSMPIHRVVVSASSDYFKASFTCGLQKTHTREIAIEDSDLEWKAIAQVVQFIYVGNLSFLKDAVQPATIHAICVSLLQAADYFSVPALCTDVASLLVYYHEKLARCALDNDELNDDNFESFFKSAEDVFDDSACKMLRELRPVFLQLFTDSRFQIMEYVINNKIVNVKRLMSSLDLTRDVLECLFGTGEGNTKGFKIVPVKST